MNFLALLPTPLGTSQRQARLHQYADGKGKLDFWVTDNPEAQYPEALTGEAATTDNQTFGTTRRKKRISLSTVSALKKPLQYSTTRCMKPSIPASIMERGSIMTTVRKRRDEIPPMSGKRANELEALSDDDIDFSDIPQLLTYAYKSLERQESVWGLATNGELYQFVHLWRGNSSTYQLMPILSLMDSGPSTQLLQVLRAICKLQNAAF